jgi:hypothetical protein
MGGLSIAVKIKIECTMTVRALIAGVVGVAGLVGRRSRDEGHHMPSKGFRFED